MTLTRDSVTPCRMRLVPGLLLVLAFSIPPVWPSAPPVFKGAFPQKFLTPEGARLFQENFRLFGDYVAKKSGVRILIEVRPDASSIENGLRDNELDFCFGLSDLEALILQDKALIIPFTTVSPFRDLPNRAFRHLLIARKEDAAATGMKLLHVEDEDEDYKGITEIFAEIIVREGQPFTLGRQSGRSPRIQVLEFGQSRDLILDVLTNPRTAAVIDEEAYLLMIRRNPQVEKTLVVLASTGPTPIPPLFLKADSDPELASRIKKVLLRMHEDPEGEEILRTVRVAKWVEVVPPDFQPLRELLERAKKLGISLKREKYASRN